MSLKKIAEMTGVSVSTVARVRNNKEYNCASPELKNRIWEAAEKIHYVPNENARSLQRGNRRLLPAPRRRLAIILGRFDSLKKDPFFSELFRSVEQEIFANECIISAFLTAAELYRKELPSADGFIIFGRSSESLLKHIQKITKNIIAIDRNPTAFEIDEVVCDGKEAAVLAMEYLISKGHEKIGYIGDCSYEARYVGYCDSLIRHKLPLDYSAIRPTDQTSRSGHEAMKKLLAQGGLSAVLCANDATALGAMQAFQDFPAPPIDLISIDNIQAAEEVSPLLTTVNIPKEDMGKMAVKILLDRIDRGHTETMRIVFPPRLVRRESC